MLDRLHELFVFPEYWHGVHLPDVMPYVALLGTIGVILAVLPMLIWLERVLLALIQDRSGPNRVGPRGLLQPVADAVKLFFKEDARPDGIDVQIYYLAPAIAVVASMAAGAVFPLQTLSFRAADGSVFTLPLMVGHVNIGLLYVLALSSLQVYGVVLAGWSSNNKYSLLGGLRGAAQLISYELSMGLALLCAIVLAGSLQLDQIVAQQNILPYPGAPEFLRGSMLTWFWLRTGIIPVIIYTIAMVAETNRVPFDLPEAESELVAGFHTEYTSMKFAMFFTAEYVAMLVVSGLNAAIFWGGPLAPINFWALGHAPYIGWLAIPFALIPGFLWFIIKIMLGIFLYIWLRGTLPRLRYDALMGLGWKRMLPLALVWLFVLAGANLAVQGAEEAGVIPKALRAAPVPAAAAPVIAPAPESHLGASDAPGIRTVQPQQGSSLAYVSSRTAREQGTSPASASSDVARMRTNAYRRDEDNRNL